MRWSGHFRCRQRRARSDGGRCGERRSSSVHRDSGTEFIIPAPLEQGTRSELGDLALRVFTLLGCRGLARIDFILDGRRPVFNELNTFPGFTQASQYPRIWAARGMGLGELLDCLIDTALVRTQPGG